MLLDGRTTLTTGKAIATFGCRCGNLPPDVGSAHKGPALNRVGTVAVLPPPARPLIISCHGGIDAR